MHYFWLTDAKEIEAVGQTDHSPAFRLLSYPASGMPTAALERGGSSNTTPYQATAEIHLRQKECDGAARPG